MGIEQDLERIALQEQRLRFDYFDAAVAWELGSKLKAMAESRRAAVAIDLSLHHQPLFFYAMPGTTSDNADWIRRKRNVVMRFGRSSYAVGLSLEQKRTSLSEQQGLPERDYATHGGAFPIVVRGAGCIGAITVSGLPQREDHAMVVEVLADYLKVPLSELALED